VGQPNTLYAGQALVSRAHSYDSLISRSGEFVLRPSTGRIYLDQIAPITGPRGPDTVETGVWHEEDTFGPPVAPNDQTALRLRRNGNLVLVTQRGRVLWSTHTKGTGTHNRLVVRDSGNLVLFTRAGKRVWASHTTPVFLGAGESLQSGHRIASLWDHNFIGFKLVTLTMERDGNLVLRCRSRVNWSTHTHVRGSHLVMQENGNAVVRAPDGRRLWSTHTAGTAYAVFEILDVKSFGRELRYEWSPKLPDPLHC
jgi:D-mannose binding lectin